MVNYMIETVRTVASAFFLSIYMSPFIQPISLALYLPVSHVYRNKNKKKEFQSANEKQPSLYG